MPTPSPSRLALAALLAPAVWGCTPTATEEAPPCAPDTSLEASTNEVVTVSATEHHVETSILIDRAAADVWGVLTDFETIEDWSSTFLGLTGDVRDGGEVVARYRVMDPASGEIIEVDFPHTLRYVEGASFGWSDPIVGFDGITDDHVFRVEPISECQSRFVQNDAFSGTNPNLTTEQLAQGSSVAYESFNTELLAEVEVRIP